MIDVTIIIVITIIIAITIIITVIVSVGNVVVTPVIDRGGEYCGREKCSCHVCRFFVLPMSNDTVITNKRVNTTTIRVTIISSINIIAIIIKVMILTLCLLITLCTLRRAMLGNWWWVDW